MPKLIKFITGRADRQRNVLTSYIISIFFSRLTCIRVLFTSNTILPRIFDHKAYILVKINTLHQRDHYDFLFVLPGYGNHLLGKTVSHTNQRQETLFPERLNINFNTQCSDIIEYSFAIANTSFFLYKIEKSLLFNIYFGIFSILIKFIKSEQFKYTKLRKSSVA